MIKSFLTGGLCGDFAHSLYAVKNICERDNCKADIYLSNHGEAWKHGIEKAYKDLYELIISLPYVNSFRIYSGIIGKSFIDMNEWRKVVATTHAETGKYNNTWTQLLSEVYKFEIPKNNQWIFIKEKEDWLKDVVLIHRSMHRHNNYFNWKDLLKRTKEQIIFITCNPREWLDFRYKDNISLWHVETVTEMAICINSCKRFIGNQSAPFAIACSLDKERLCELDTDPAPFYMGEEKYSDKIKWYLNEQVNYL